MSMDLVKKMLKIKCRCGRAALYVDRRGGYCEHCMPVMEKKGARLKKVT